MTTATLNEPYAELERLLDRGTSLEQVLYRLAETMHTENARFRWVGIYRLTAEGHLRLGPFHGDPTDHVYIPHGRGVCGVAAVEQRTFNVPDVSQFRGYLRCSAATRSELAVPIASEEQVFGVIDIHSDEPAAFGREAVVATEALARWLAACFEEQDLHGRDELRLARSVAG